MCSTRATIPRGSHGKRRRTRSESRAVMDRSRRSRRWPSNVTSRSPASRMRPGITVDGKPEQTRLLLVANNAYVLEPPSIGARERLDEGRLYLYVVRGGVDERNGTSFVVDTRAGRIEAAVDGEPDVLETPIEF